jgi:hypothetical protein
LFFLEDILKKEIKRRARIIFPQRIPKTMAVAKIQPVPNKNIGNAFSIPIHIIDNKIYHEYL